MQLGLRAILLVVAIIFFIVAAITTGADAFNFLVLGLACFAGALLVEELGGVSGVGRMGGGRRSDA
ncbi:MAG TPA: hypothetical protein VGH79_00710 [Gaiellaceae bacterium]|jgi:hypothetical protein